MDEEVLDKLRKESFPLVGNLQGVYLLFEGEELVYIGQGWNCFLRVAEHTKKNSNKLFTSWNFIPVEEPEDLDHFEKFLIQEHRPKYNVQHNRQNT